MISHDPLNEVLPSILSFRSVGGYPSKLHRTITGIDVLTIKLSGYGIETDAGNSVQDTHFVHSFTEAKNILLDMVYSHARLPFMIIYEGRIRFAEIRQFYSFLQSIPALHNIPFVYNNNSVGVFSEDELYDMVKHQLFDDVINQDESFESLKQGAEIIGNMKRLKHTDSHISNTADAFHLKDKFELGYFLKRSLDVLVASTALLLFAPLMAVIAVMIYLESKGPIFYISKRAGRCFDVFDFYKFRTMIPDADKKLDEYACLNQYNNDVATEGPRFFKIDNDPRVTKLGAFLRKTSLDELPQLFNVLKGDMSLVGNRPLPLYEASTLTNNEWAERFLAPAGITGLWQISKRGKANMSVNERIDLDIEYSRNNSFLYDLRIIVKTPQAMFQDAKV
jgi:lipopolysaccharide/colanic/teichoic acid biosynthesis glycosyltransferase